MDIQGHPPKKIFTNISSQGYLKILILLAYLCVRGIFNTKEYFKYIVSRDVVERAFFRLELTNLLFTYTVRDCTTAFL